MTMIRLALLSVGLVAGCASGVVAVTPYTSPAIEAARATCLDQPGAVWMETTDRARCSVPIPAPEQDLRT